MASFNLPILNTQGVDIDIGFKNHVGQPASPPADAALTVSPADSGAATLINNGATMRFIPTTASGSVVVAYTAAAVEGFDITFTVAADGVALATPDIANARFFPKDNPPA